MIELFELIKGREVELPLLTNRESTREIIIRVAKVASVAATKR